MPTLHKFKKIKNSNDLQHYFRVRDRVFKSIILEPYHKECVVELIYPFHDLENELQKADYLWNVLVESLLLDTETNMKKGEYMFLSNINKGLPSLNDFVLLNNIALPIFHKVPVTI
jgi:hypothetical protein